MEEKQKKDILAVITSALDAIKKKDVRILKDISNRTIHNATIIQDEYSISVAILMYSLSKVFEREWHYSQFKGWEKFCPGCLSVLEDAKGKLEKDDVEGFDSALKRFMGLISEFDPKLKKYIREVLHKARINKASRLYEHGLSIGRTARLLGVTKFELMDYVGKTGIADVKGSITGDPVARLNMARGLFK